MEALLNTAMLADVYEDGGYCLYFYPSCFLVMESTMDGFGGILRGDVISAGDWTVADSQIYLLYDDGTEEWLDMPDEDFALCIPSLDCWFFPQ